jgi:hypothetical protein
MTKEEYLAIVASRYEELEALKEITCTRTGNRY